MHARRHARAAAVLTAMLASCQNDTATPQADVPTPGPGSHDPVPAVDTSLDTAAATPCVAISQISPGEGATNIFFRAPLRVDLDGDGRQVLQVGDFQSASGQVQASTLAWTGDGRRALIQSPAALQASVDWQLDLSTECDHQRARFQTSATGQPIASGSVTGRYYVLEPDGLRGLAPHTLDDDALRQAARWWRNAYALYLAGWSSTRRSYDLQMFGLPPQPEHPPAPAAALPIAEESGWRLTENPFLQLDVLGGEARVPIAWAGPLGLAVSTLDLPSVPDHRQPVPVERLSLTGAFTPDRAQLDGLRLRTQVDARAILQALGAQGYRVSLNALCSASLALGAPCQPCADGVRSCVASDLDGLVATHDPSVGETP